MLEKLKIANKSAVWISLSVILGFPIAGCAQLVPQAKPKPATVVKPKATPVDDIGSNAGPAEVAQDQNAGVRFGRGELGVLSFAVQLPRGWGEGSLTKVAERLKFDGNDLEPVFAFENQAGGVLFGTWRDFKAGQIFTAQALASDVPGMPSDWGISKNDVLSTADTNARFEYAVLKAVGMGDGINFSPSGARRTVSLWIDIPVAYQDKGDTRSGLASVYYRGPVESYPDAKALIDTILNGMNATQVTLISVAEFKNRMAFKQAVPPPKPAANSAVPAPVPAQKVEVINSNSMSKEIKQKIVNKLENVKRQFREKEILEENIKREMREIETLIAL
jgi:hypothetical protein